MILGLDQPVLSKARVAIMSSKEKLRRLTTVVNLWLKKVIGAENVILFRFSQFFLVAVVLALAIFVVLEIVALVLKAVSLAVAALVVALPFLLAVAAAAAVLAGLIYVYRKGKSKQRRKVEESMEVAGQNAPQDSAVARPGPPGGGGRGN